MKENRSSKWSMRLLKSAIAMIAIGISTAPAVYAKPKSNKMADKPANVVAHVQLSGGSVTRMLLVKKNGKEYLLLGLDSAATVTIMDVSEPGQAHVIDNPSGADGAKSAEVAVVADTLAVFGSSDAQTSTSSKFKEIRSLSGVTAFMKDKARGLLYVTNGDGLWIIKSKQQAETEAAYDSYGN
jgi:hypothetical protein